MLFPPSSGFAPRDGHIVAAAPPAAPSFPCSSCSANLSLFAGVDFATAFVALTAESTWYSCSRSVIQSVCIALEADPSEMPGEDYDPFSSSSAPRFRPRA